MNMIGDGEFEGGSFHIQVNMAPLERGAGPAAFGPRALFPRLGERGPLKADVWSLEQRDEDCFHVQVNAAPLKAA